MSVTQSTLQHPERCCIYSMQDGYKIILQSDKEAYFEKGGWFNTVAEAAEHVEKKYQKGVDDLNDEYLIAKKRGRPRKDDGDRE